LFDPTEEELGARLQHPLRSDAKIEVVFESGGDKLLERVVLEQIGPLRIRERCGGAAGGRASILIRRPNHRPFVVGADGTAGHDQRQQKIG